jgi:magnesium transporter
MIKKKENEGLVWINLIDYKEEELEKVRKEFGFHPLDIEDTKKYRFRPKIIEHPDYIYMDLQIPIYEKDSKRIIMGEIDVFLTSAAVVTIPNQEIEDFTGFWKSFKPEMIPVNVGNKSGYLFYLILRELFYSPIIKLDYLSKEIEDVEKRVFDRKSGDILEDILRIERDIINIRRIINPQREILKPITEKRIKFLPDELIKNFKSVSDLILKTSETVESLFEMINSLEELNREYVSYSLNQKMKIFAVFSALLFPASFIMNILTAALKGNPMLSLEGGFFILLWVVLITVFSGILYVRRKKII